LIDLDVRRMTAPSNDLRKLALTGPLTESVQWPTHQLPQS
jgi:hypothetical protein